MYQTSPCRSISIFDAVVSGKYDLIYTLQRAAVFRVLNDHRGAFMRHIKALPLPASSEKFQDLSLLITLHCNDLSWNCVVFPPFFSILSYKFPSLGIRIESFSSVFYIRRSPGAFITFTIFLSFSFLCTFF